MAVLRLFSIHFPAKNLINPFSTRSTAIGAWGLVDRVSVTDNGRIYVAWHPKNEFPYEQSKPIPEVEIRDQSSVIKEGSINTAMKAFHQKKTEIARQELSKLTFTTKHRWFLRARDKKAKKTAMDREYL